MKVFILTLLFISTAHAWQRDFSFTYKEVEYSFSITFDDVYINDCRLKTKEWQNKYGTHTENYQKNIYKYVELYPCRKVVQTIAEKLHQQFLKVEKARPWDEINFNIAFVNHLHYEHDNVTYAEPEYYATPFETIDQKQQDCEDSSFLLTQLFYILGYNSLIVTLPTHVAVCVDPFTNGSCNNVNDKTEIDKWSFVTEGATKYYYCETTPNKPQKCYEMGTRPSFAKGKIESQQLVLSEFQKKQNEQMEINVARAASVLVDKQNNANQESISVPESRLIRSGNGGALYIEKKREPSYQPKPTWKIPRL